MSACTSYNRLWTPDPRLLLGPYEEDEPRRLTNARFLTANNTVTTVQVGTTAALRCQINDVAEHETVAARRVCVPRGGPQDRQPQSATRQIWRLNRELVRRRSSLGRSLLHAVVVARRALPYR
ncbi:hypothetical protein E2C01_035323 [Portunus trituberculatus]|uniref:Uncharacterized protein n=1 Tax=Portunus trituberculatus TaxID=210409 RepID=A0A5B7F5E4_PORTR|nr:hypothetical protein [Portunus trituberculatus]